VWRRYRGRRWHRALEEGLTPVGIGLVLAGAVSVLRVSGGGALAWLLALATAALLMWKPKLHPLIVFAIGGAVFVLLNALRTPQPRPAQKAPAASAPAGVIEGEFKVVRETAPHH
jgi:chromate transporter